MDEGNITIQETRQVTDHCVEKYLPMVNKYINTMVIKNWKEAQNYESQYDITLGNTGISIQDIKQHLLAEVVVALQKYNPNYRTAEGKSVKESTFVFRHLFNRTGQYMKKLTNKRNGYGIWSASFDDVMAAMEGNTDNIKMQK